MTDLLRDWTALARRQDDEINLAEAAAWVARIEYPNLDVAGVLARLDALASGVKADPSYSPYTNIHALNERLFEQEKFRGNEAEYDDPRNSYLNDVLERRLGIPITLSLIYAEVARRRGLSVVGVGFPGHFIVKYLSPANEILIDPYNGGAILTLQDCIRRLKSDFGEGAQFKPEFLSSSTSKQILARMLNNLKGSYFRRRDYARVLAIIELSLVINSESTADIRDRGMVYFAMKRYHEAMTDFKTYLRSSENDDPHVREVREAMHRIQAMMN